jgi:hypothetical protein
LEQGEGGEFSLGVKLECLLGNKREVVEGNSETVIVNDISIDGEEERSKDCVLCTPAIRSQKKEEKCQ